MTDLVQNLQKQLDQVLRLADDPHLLALSAGDGNVLREQAVALSQKLEQAEGEPLSIGLLGGTGVGKSTVLNALAGSEISAASHRRPRTDQVLIYRHEEAKKLSLNGLSHIPWQEVTHRNDTIGKVLLCDLPDFDSIQVVHRERVLGFLEHLDLVIWVTSPEKYADQEFHDFLAAAPKSQQNFFFVLNKLDLAFCDGTAENGYEEVSTMSQTFRKCLQKSGISDPLVFFVSAKASLDGGPLAPWNQFPTFKNQVFQERRLKEVLTIKASNLDVEIQSLLRHVREGVRSLDTFEEILVGTIAYMQTHRTDWSDEWGGAIEGWAEHHFRKKMEAQRPDPVPLLGPGFGLSVIMDRIKKGPGKAEKTFSKTPTGFPSNAVFSTFETQLSTVATRIETERLRQGLPESFKGRVDNMLRRSERLKNLETAASRTLARHMNRAPWPSFLGFRIWQGGSYLMVLVIFLLAIGGETAWGNVLDNPGLKTLAHLILSIVHTLFSGKGFAALGSYVILNLFLGFRFYRRFSTLAKRVADKRVADLKKGLAVVWENEIDSLYDAFRETHEDIEKEKSTIISITGTSSD